MIQQSFAVRLFPKIALFLVFILIAGAWLRARGVSTHVTYIDEMIVLADGEWHRQEMHPAEGAKTPFEYGASILTSAKSSYAPGQLIGTFLLFPDKRFSWQSLVRARWVSFLVGIAGLFACLWLTQRITGSAFHPAGLLPLSLVAFSRMSIINAQQAHCYAFSVLGAILAVILSDILARGRTALGRVGAAALLAALPWFNYQLIFFSVAGYLVSVAAAILCLLSKTGPRTNSFVTTIASVIGLALTGTLAYFLEKLKGHLSIAWWVSDYAFHGRVSFPSLVELARRVRKVAEAVILPAHEGLLTATTVAALFLLAVFAVVASFRRQPALRSVVAVSTTTFLMFCGAYLAGRIPLSPSRHGLVFLPLLTTLSLVGLASLRSPAHLRLASIATILWSGIWATVAIEFQQMDFPRSVETFDARMIQTLASKHQVRTIATSYFEYTKLSLLLDDTPSSANLQLVSAVKQSELPSERHLLVGQMARRFADFYDLSSNPRVTQRLLHADAQSYDFEPSSYIEDWPNEFWIWLVEPSETFTPDTLP